MKDVYLMTSRSTKTRLCLNDTIPYYKSPVSSIFGLKFLLHLCIQRKDGYSVIVVVQLREVLLNERFQHPSR